MRSLKDKLGRLGGREQAALGHAAPQAQKPAGTRTPPLADCIEASSSKEALLAGKAKPALNWFVERVAKDATHGNVPLHALLRVQRSSLRALSRDARFESIAPEDLLFIDTETTGLKGGVGVVAFLVGVAFFRHNQLFVEQLQLTGFGNEAPMLHRISSHLMRARALVSYNGKCFDWPLLRSRFLLNGIALPEYALTLPHLDLLHASRRLVLNTSDHRLTTLERRLCNFMRIDDIPSAFIPLRFAAYARGEIQSLGDVVEHNRHDIVAMVAFIVVLAKRLEDMRCVSLASGELLAVARTKWFAHQRKEALDVARRALDCADGAEAICAAIWAARLHGREGAWAMAARLLERALLAAPTAAAPAHLALAKIFEHRLVDLPRALRHAHRAIGAETSEAHQKRVNRLHRRIALKTQGLAGAQTGRKKRTKPFCRPSIDGDSFRSL